MLLVAVQSEVLSYGLRSGHEEVLLATDKERIVFSLDYDPVERKVFWMDLATESISWQGLDSGKKGTLVKGRLWLPCVCAIPRMQLHQAASPRTQRCWGEPELLACWRPSLGAFLPQHFALWVLTPGHVAGVRSDCIAVDWLGRNLYWTDGAAGQVLATRLGAAWRGKPEYTVVLDGDMDQPHSLVLQPLAG